MVSYEGKSLMKLVVTEYISLDGVVENPLWIGPYFDDDFLKFKFDELFAGDALLMGRHTYDYFIPVWASETPVEDAPGQEGFAARLNQLPKYVVSTTLRTLTWNNTHVIQENIIEAVRNLKQQPGGDILVAGSTTLVQTLMQHGLVDEYRFLIYPVVVGSGQRFFEGQKVDALSLLESKTFSTGVVALTYCPMP
ncbi:MAG: dihydrofolate reductase family protein [Chitinophagaceae bacterium]|nr:dihydrofolate reductase family protein [Anaerolineae bacterium]